MKKLFIIILLYIFLINLSNIFSQEIKNLDNIKERLSLTKQKCLSDEMQLEILKLSLTHIYGNNFKFYEELENKLYNFEKTANGYNLNIYYNDKKKIKATIKIVRNKSATKDNCLYFAKNELDKYIDYNQLNITSNNIFNNKFPEITNNILWDRVIIDIPDFQSKILNRSICRNYFINQYGEPSSVFLDLKDGSFIPFNNGISSKIICVDYLWCSLVYGDVESIEEGVRYHGKYGYKNNQFYLPSSITIGREINYFNQIIYPVFIADPGNKRVCKIDYVINTNSKNSDFDDNSFLVIKNDRFSPDDISYFKASSQNNDKIWIAERSGNMVPSLACISEEGILLQRIAGYRSRFGGGDFLFLNKSKLYIATYDIGFNSLFFIDDQRNRIVPCRLDTNGLGELIYIGDNKYLIVAEHLLDFPVDYRVNSLNFQKTSSVTSMYPYLWVTTGFNPPFEHSISMIHGFAVNLNSNWAYLGSTSLPLNTNYTFNDLTNTIITNHYYDIFTTEAWSDVYGLRKYFPFIDVFDDEVHSYCSDNTDRLLWDARFTSECWIKIWAERKAGNNTWQSVAIKEIEGIIKPPNTYEAVIFRLKGSTIGWLDNIDIKLDLPIQDYALGGTLRLHAKLYPEYFDPNNLDQYSEYTQRDYEVDIKKNCLPKPGGCPFIYVKDINNENTLDNNILHKSEFINSGQDIHDLYKLNIQPSTENNEITIHIVENENDVCSFNQFVVIAVDHPSDKIVAITENNHIVLLDDSQVKNADYAALNGLDITSRIIYPGTLNPVSTFTNDSLFADYNNVYDNQKKERALNKININYKKQKTEVSEINPLSISESISVIMDLSNLDTIQPFTTKNWAGIMSVNTVLGSYISDKYFSRRERNNMVVIPILPFVNAIENDDVDYLNIKWLSNCKIKYISLVNVRYNDPDMIVYSELTPINASLITRNSSSDITIQLNTIDEQRVSMDSSAFITIKFDVSNLGEPTPGYVRDYVIKSVGYYNKESMKIPLYNSNSENPLTFILYTNYPNPFNPVTIIKYELPKSVKVTLKVYDVLGRLVRTLVDNEQKEPGRYEVTFDATGLASGIYFYTIEAGEFKQSRKMVLVR